ncbi:hypothetical protein RSAG8_08746, partial [Rhizoctonia solani AG-8 WAC10335]
MADDMDMMAMMGMAGFGKQTKKRAVDVAARYETTKRVDEAVEKDGLKVEDNPAAKRARIGENVPEEDDEGPMPLPGPGPSAKKQDGVEDDEDEDDEDDGVDSDLDDESTFPITHEITLKDHTKVVSALAVDPSGARVVTGSHDYDVKLWDFGGMDARFKPFRSWEPAESYHVHDLKYSNAGDKFLIISGTSQAKLYERDGEEVATFIKGDPYIRDMKNTAGHVGELTACAWHPKESNLFITSSYDSTIRIWDVENKRKQKTVIVVKSKERGTRTKVMSCAYSRDGKMIAGACLDGALHIWNTNSNFVRPSLSIEGAHVKDTETGSVTFAFDGHTVLTRGGDDTVKLWDTRSFKKPVTTATDVPTLYPGTSAIFSPDEKYIVTGAAAVPGRQPGRLLFMRRDGASGENELKPARSVVLGEKRRSLMVRCEYCTRPIHRPTEPSCVSPAHPRRLRSKMSVRPCGMHPSSRRMHSQCSGKTRAGPDSAGATRTDPTRSRRASPCHRSVGQDAVDESVQARRSTLCSTCSATLRATKTHARRCSSMRPRTGRNSGGPRPGRILATYLQRLRRRRRKRARRWGGECTDHVTRKEHRMQISEALGSDKGRRGDSRKIARLLRIYPPADTVLGYPGDDDDETATRNESPPVTTPADHDVRPPTKLDPADTDMDPVDGAVAAETPATAAPEPVPIDSHVQETDRKRELPTDEIEHVAKRPRSDASGSQQPYGLKPQSSAPVDPLAAYTTFQDPPPPPYLGPTLMSPTQHKFCVSTVRTLKRLKDALPFLHPVDPIALNIPHYPIVVKRPMDFS